MSPMLEVRILMVVPGEWQYRLLIGGGSILTADGDETYPAAAYALRAGLEAAQAEQAQRRARRAAVED